MSFLQSLVNVLRSTGTPVKVVECKDDRLHQENYLVNKEDITVEYFDGRPQQARGNGWRCNKDGKEF